MRKRMSRSKSRRTFKKGVVRSHRNNSRPQLNYWQRGGIRL